MEQLYLFEILIESIEIANDENTVSLVKDVKCNVKWSKAINFTVDEAPENYEQKFDFESGKSILFPMTKVKMLKLMKSDKLIIDIMNISKKEHIGTARVPWPAAFQAIVKEGQIKKKPLTNQSSHDLTVSGPPAKKGSKATSLKIGTLKIYMVFNVFGQKIEVDFQLMNQTFDYGKLKEKRLHGSANVPVQAPAKEVTAKEVAAAKDATAAKETWEPLFMSTHKEKQSFIEPELRIFAELAGIVIGESWADKLTPEFINKKLCGGKHCPGAVKFKDLGIGPLAQGTCLGGITAVNKTKPEGVYGISQAYGTMDDYGAFGLFIKDKKPPNKTCGSPACTHTIQPNVFNNRKEEVEGCANKQCGMVKYKRNPLPITDSNIDKFANIKCESPDCPFTTSTLRTKCSDPACPFAKLQRSLDKIKSELNSISKYKEDDFSMQKHPNSLCASRESAIDSTMRKSCGCHNLLAHTKPGKHVPKCMNQSCCRRQSAGADNCGGPRCCFSNASTSRGRTNQPATDDCCGTSSSAQRSSQPRRNVQCLDECNGPTPPKRMNYLSNDGCCNIPPCMKPKNNTRQAQNMYPASSNQRRSRFSYPECPYANQGPSYPQLGSCPSNQQEDDADCGQICPYPGTNQKRGPSCSCSCSNQNTAPTQRRISYSPMNTCGGPSCPYSQAARLNFDCSTCGQPSCPYLLSDGPDSRRLSMQGNCGGVVCPLSSFASTMNPPSLTRQCDDSLSKFIPSDYATAGSFMDNSIVLGKERDHSKSMNNYLSYEDFVDEDAEKSRRKARKHKEKTKRSGPCGQETCRFKKYNTCSECGGISKSGATCDNSKVSFSTISYDDVSCDPINLTAEDLARMNKKDDEGEVAGNEPPVIVKFPSATKKTSFSFSHRRKARNHRFVHRVGEIYPGFRVAHRTCFMATGPNVPWNMGWLWSTPCEPGLRKRKGWRPGVLGRTINERILARRKELGIPDPPELKMLGTRKKFRSNRFEVEEESEEEVEYLPKPTLTIQRKDGQYLITMHPLKDPKTLAENEYPYIECAPMQFAIIKPKPEPNELKHDAICSPEDDEYFYQDCLCDEDKNILDLDSLSSNSELNIEFTTPAGLIFPERLQRLPNLIHTDTQFKENDFNCSDCAIVVPNKYKKDKKKGKGRR